MSKTAIKTVVSAIQKFYPLKLADSSWDNTGLLVDASSEEEIANEKIKILLTIDLTQSVAEEAIQNKSSLILAYHPFIFRGLKSITPTDPQQKSLIKLIKNGISVYSPHTAVDSAIGGVNDFLADGISEGNESSRKVLEASKVVTGAGMGRLVTLEKPLPLKEIVAKIKAHLMLSHVQVAPAKSKSVDSIKTIAICAGSGGSIFKGVNADLFYTGELSHHEALYFTESGSSVVACNHTNTERGFLKILKNQLEEELVSKGHEVEVNISKSDSDPYQTW